MKIDRIELRQINLPYISPFRSSGWTEEGNNSVIVKVFSEGVAGWGESSVSKFPYYIEETSSTVLSVQKEVLIPLILKKEVTHPGELSDIFKNIRGNRFAIAGLETIVKNPFELNSDGTLTLPAESGHGAVVDEKYLNQITINKIIIK